MLHVRLADALQSEFLNQTGDVYESCAHVDGKVFELRIHDVIQGLDNPSH